MKHANARGVFGESEMVLGHEGGERGTVRLRIAELFGVVAEESFDVIDKRQPAEVGLAGKFVIVRVFIGWEKVLELDPIKTVYAAARIGFDEEVLLGDGVAVEIDDLRADEVKLPGEGEVGGGILLRVDGLVLDLALNGRERRRLRDDEGGDQESQKDGG